MRLASFGILTAGLSTLLSGCASMHHADTASLPTGTWSLTSIEGEPFPDPLPAGLRPVTLTIAEDGAVSGSAGVNRYSGSVETAPWADGKIEFAPLAVTRMAGPPEAMAIESAYLGALGELRTFEVTTDALTLLGDAGELLRFQQAE